MAQVGTIELYTDGSTLLRDANGFVVLSGRGLRDIHVETAIDNLYRTARLLPFSKAGDKKVIRAEVTIQRHRDASGTEYTPDLRKHVTSLYHSPKGLWYTIVDIEEV